jgi:hypothetical protein
MISYDTMAPSSFEDIVCAAAKSADPRATVRDCLQDADADAAAELRVLLETGVLDAVIRAVRRSAKVCWACCE